MDDYVRHAIRECNDIALRTVGAGRKIELMGVRANHMLVSILDNVDNYEYPSFAVNDMRQVTALLGRAVLETIAERARP